MTPERKAILEQVRADPTLLLDQSLVTVGDVEKRIAERRARWEESVRRLTAP